MPAPGGCLLPGGVAFWFGGLLIEGGLLVESGLLLWPSGVIFWYGLLVPGGSPNRDPFQSEGHNRRPPHQKAIPEWPSGVTFWSGGLLVERVLVMAFCPPPPHRRLLLRMVRILLECILVACRCWLLFIKSFHFFKYHCSCSITKIITTTDTIFVSNKGNKVDAKR